LISGRRLGEGVGEELGPRLSVLRSKRKRNACQLVACSLIRGEGVEEGGARMNCTANQNSRTQENYAKEKGNPGAPAKKFLEGQTEGAREGKKVGVDAHVCRRRGSLVAFGGKFVVELQNKGQNRSVEIGVKRCRMRGTPWVQSSRGYRGEAGAQIVAGQKKSSRNTEPKKKISYQ